MKEPTSPQEIRVLLADTDMAFCIAARRALQRDGYVVTIAHDGGTLLQTFTPERFDVVVANVALSPLEDLQPLHLVRRQDPDIPVILLADPAHEHLAITGLREGAFAYFLTPLDDVPPVEFAIARAAELAQLRLRVGSLNEQLAAPNTPPARALRELSDLMRNGTLADTLRLLATHCAQLLEAPRAVILLRESGALSLSLFVTHGFANVENAALEFAHEVNEQFPRRVVAERKTLIELMTLPDNAPLATQVIGTPLNAAGDMLGALIIYPIPARPVNAARLAWLETFAAHAVLAIEMARLRAETEQLTPLDPVTGVFKRQAFLDLADREFRRSWRYNQPITAIIVDMDEMHLLNQRSGHAFGDLALLQVANVCREVVRSIDLVGRYDADAIALLLLMTERESAQIVAERLRAGISHLHLNDGRHNIRITASLGICSYPHDNCTSIFDLLAMAQQAQALAHQLGTNQVAYE